MEKSKLLITRLAMIAEALSINANQIQKGTGISRAQIPNIFNHINEPSISKFLTLEAFILDKFKECDVTVKAEIGKKLREIGIDSDIMQPMVIYADIASGKDQIATVLVSQTKEFTYITDVSPNDVVQSLDCGCKMEANIFKRGKGCIKKKSDHYFLNL